MRSRSISRLLFPFVSLFLLPAPSAAQDELARLRSDLLALRDEVQRLRAEVAALRGPAPEAAPAAPHPSDAATLTMLTSQVAELANTKVESTSRLPVKVFGTIHAHGFVNTGDANWLDNPNLVGARTGTAPTGSLSAALRQSRIGFSLDGPDVGPLRASGVVAFDFFGGVPGFQTGQTMALPRLLVAYARLEGERTAVSVGQDHMLLAPRDPTSLAALAFPSLFRSGNLYLRVPQARVEHRFAEHMTIKAALGAPIAGDLADEAYRFVPPPLGGERSRLPGVQAHLGYARGADDARRRLAVGLSAHASRERQDASDVSSRAVAFDFAWRADRIGMAGEIFGGRNLDAFGGGLGLTPRAAGGWSEVQWYVTSRVKSTAGVGLDEIRAARLALPRSRNRSAFANVLLAVTPELEASLEYRWLETRPGTGAVRRNHHVDWVLAYHF